MKKIIVRTKKDTGNVSVVALMILVVLTLIGISASRISSTDMLIAQNQIPFKEDFYIAEGGQNMEAIKISRGDYPVYSNEDPGVVLDSATSEISEGNHYDYEITYKGAYHPPSGYSILHFKRFDYGVKTKISKTELTINARYYIIGPKME